MREHGERLQRLQQEWQEHVQAWRLSPVVEALQALGGVQCTVAVTLVADMGDLTRFENPRELMQCMGLIPSEYSSGEQRRQGSITTAGNTHARRVLVKGAWASRYPAKVSRPLQLRRETQPKVIHDVIWKAQVRLCKRYRRLVSRGKHANVVTVAIARELAGCIWAMAKEVLSLAQPLKTPSGLASIMCRQRLVAAAARSEAWQSFARSGHAAQGRLRERLRGFPALGPRHGRFEDAEGGRFQTGLPGKKGE